MVVGHILMYLGSAVDWYHHLCGLMFFCVCVCVFIPLLANFLKNGMSVQHICVDPGVLLSSTGFLENPLAVTSRVVLRSLI